MFESDEVIERKYRDKSTAYAMGIMHGGFIGVIGALLSCGVMYITFIYS